MQKSLGKVKSMDQQDEERQKIFRVVYNKVMNGHIPKYEASLKY